MAGARAGYLTPLLKRPYWPLPAGSQLMTLTR
jgi:hypothetical protein